jgi:hypothetical protein
VHADADIVHDQITWYVGGFCLLIIELDEWHDPLNLESKGLYSKLSTRYG